MVVGEKGVAWRRLRVRGTPGHGSMPFGSDNALVTAAKVVRRLADYRPTPRFHELWRGQVESMGLPDDMQAAMLDESTIDDLLADLPQPGAKGYLHACTHTTFSPNVVATKGRPKTNVIPDVVDLDIDIRTMPGDHTDEVDGAPACRARRRPLRAGRHGDPDGRPGIDQPDRHAAVGCARSAPSTCRSPMPA